jgi:hypothetical protein
VCSKQAGRQASKVKVKDIGRLEICSKVDRGREEQEQLKRVFSFEKGDRFAWKGRKYSGSW